MEFWYQKSFWALLLFPLSLVFRGIVCFRRYLYTKGFMKSTVFPVPVIVVGNITVGGTGKTPAVLGIIELLKEEGYKPGIVSRGYGKEFPKKLTWVTEKSTPTSVGDEAILLQQRSNVPMVVGANRRQAVKELLARSDCDIVISDDGLQHYALARQLEIVVVDATRQFGNGFLLPAGPLREPLKRLKSVDMVLYNTETSPTMPYSMMLFPQALVSHHNPMLEKPLREFAGKTVHGVAGIGNPKRFFNLLRTYGLMVIEHPFPDHYVYESRDLSFKEDLPIIMTEKDSVKCKEFKRNNLWYVPVQTHFSPVFVDDFKKHVNAIMKSHE